ncbi:MAG: hypothetical protein Q4D43_03380 [Clostridia bacterium]|nr:hypothetical protein [Clostridia bacterium]
MLKKIPDSLYDLAFQFKETRLWKKLWDSELFAVKLDDGSIGYCCVMGKNGEHIALAVYLGDAGLDSYRAIADQEFIVDECELHECGLRQDCVSVSFETREFIHPITWDEMGEYCARRGIVRRGAMKLPNFERMKPYRSIWYITDERDAAHIRAGLEAALEVSERLKTATPKQLGFSQEAPFNRSIPLLTKTESGYTWSSITLSPHRTIQDYPEGHIDEFTLMRLKKVKKTGHTWSVRIFSSPEPISIEELESDGRMEAPVFPFILMAADETDQRVLDVAVCQDADEASFNESFTSRFVKQILDEGKPAKLIAEGERAEDFFTDICDQLDIQIELSDDGDTLNDAVDHFIAEMEGDELPDDLDMDEEIQQLMQLLKDPDDCRKIPNAFLRQLARLASMGIFPEEAAELIQREMQRRGLQ